jgi:hypothetical protein
VARLRLEGRQLGWGVHAGGTVDWDGASDAFAQLVDPPAMVLQELGTFDSLAQVRVSGWVWAGAKQDGIQAGDGCQPLLPRCRHRRVQLGTLSCCLPLASMPGWAGNSPVQLVGAGWARRCLPPDCCCLPACCARS